MRERDRFTLQAAVLAVVMVCLAATAGLEGSLWWLAGEVPAAVAYVLLALRAVRAGSAARAEGETVER